MEYIGFKIITIYAKRFAKRVLMYGKVCLY